MKFYYFLLVSSILVSGCATTRTKYQPHGDSGGYSEKKVDDRIMVARFVGNAYTVKDDASGFSQFRAMEICKDGGYRIARIFEVKDLSTSQTVQKTSNYNNQQPTYVTGTANTNANYNYYGGGYGQANANTNYNGTISGGGTQGGSTAWQETYIYPTFDTYFSCTNQAYMTRVKLKLVSVDDMKIYVKDLMGAMQVEDILENSPNKSILQVGDIVIKVNNSRVQNLPQIVSAIDSSKDKNKISMNIARDGKIITVSAKAIDATPMLEAETNKLISAACSISEVKSRPICVGRVPASK